MNGSIKNALLAVVIVAVVAGSILLGIKPNIEAKQELDAEIATLQTRLAELQAKEADRPIYEAGIVKNRQTFAEYMKKFPNGIEQENYIKFLGDLEDNEDIEYFMSSEGFSEVTQFYTLGDGGVPAAGADVAATDGVAADGTADAGANSVAAETATVDPMDETNVVGISTPINIAYKGSYTGIKNLLAYITTHDERMTIDTMSLAYDEEAEDKDKVSGSLNLNLYAITSDQRYFEQPDIKDVEVGRDNIFTDEKENSSLNKKIAAKMDDGRSIKSSYDYYVALNPATSNNNAVAIGAKNDNSTMISTNVNEPVNATIKFFMVGVKYYVSYNIGNVTFPENFEEGSEFDPGDSLDLLIQSTKRKNDKDKSGVKLVIDNETDLKCNVLVDGDDEESPRVKIVSRIGQVSIKE